MDEDAWVMGPARRHHHVTQEAMLHQFYPHLTGAGRHRKQLGHRRDDALASTWHHMDIRAPWAGPPRATVRSQLPPATVNVWSSVDSPSSSNPTHSSIISIVEPTARSCFNVVDLSTLEPVPAFFTPSMVSSFLPSVSLPDNPCAPRLVGIAGIDMVTPLDFRPPPPLSIPPLDLSLSIPVMADVSSPLSPSEREILTTSATTTSATPPTLVTRLCSALPRVVSTVRSVLAHTRDWWHDDDDNSDDNESSSSTIAPRAVWYPPIDPIAREQERRAMGPPTTRDVLPMHDTSSGSDARETSPFPPCVHAIPPSLAILGGATASRGVPSASIPSHQAPSLAPPTAPVPVPATPRSAWMVFERAWEQWMMLPALYRAGFWARSKLSALSYPLSLDSVLRWKSTVC